MLIELVIYYIHHFSFKRFLMNSRKIFMHTRIYGGNG